MAKEEKKKVEKISKKEKELMAQNQELNEKVLRITAEVQNILRRNEEDRSKLLKYDGESFIKRTLDVIDNFERAIKLDDDNLDDEVSKFLSGFKLIYADLLHILEDNEVMEIKCLNEEFDPNKMEAVVVENNKKVAPNIVVDVLQKGYLYKDKVIRPAMVKVNQ